MASPEQVLAAWPDIGVRRVVMGGPAEGPEVIPCPALVTVPPGSGGAPVVRVAYELEPGDLEALAGGGTLWLSTWGGLPIHALHVQPAPDGASS